MTSLWKLSSCFYISALELGGLPFSCTKHLSSELSFKLGAHWSIVLALGHLVGLLADDRDELTLLEQINLLLVVALNSWSLKEVLQLLLVLIDELLSNAHDFVLSLASQLDPFVLHGLSESDLGNLGADLAFNGALFSLHSNFESLSVLELWSAILHVTFALISQINFLALNYGKHDILVNKETLDSSVKLGRCDLKRLNELQSVINLVFVAQQSQHVLLELIICHFACGHCFNHCLCDVCDEGFLYILDPLCLLKLL